MPLYYIRYILKPLLSGVVLVQDFLSAYLLYINIRMSYTGATLVYNKVATRTAPKADQV